LGLFIAGVVMSMAQAAAAAVVVLPPNTPHDQIAAWGQARPVIAERADPFVSQATLLGDGVTFYSTSSTSLLGQSQPYTFPGGQTWASAKIPMAGANAVQGAISFTFATPVSAIIAQTNWAALPAGSPPVTVSVFDEADKLIETLVLNDGTKDLQTHGGYVGFVESTAVIARIEFSNGYIGVRDLYSRYTSNTEGQMRGALGDGGTGGTAGTGGDDGAPPSGAPGASGGDGPGAGDPGPSDPTSGPPGDGLPGAGLPQGGLPAAAVPEPGTWALMLIGFGFVGLTARRRRTALA
jgi:hypothetical protein